MSASAWFAVRAPLTPRRKLLLGIGSFVLPLLLWAAVSYVPWLWHPQVLVTSAGEVDYLEPGMRMDRALFADEVVAMQEAGKAPPQGTPEKVRDQTGGPAVPMIARALAWPALLRKLDRIDPSYRN